MGAIGLKHKGATFFVRLLSVNIYTADDRCLYLKSV
jgi:hypothetical protein